MILLTEILLIIVASFLLLLGINFRKGRWLRLIAGNIFNDYPNEKAEVTGKLLGIVLYGASLCLLILAVCIFIKIL
ncbi:TPA: hypothetical protein ACN1ND_000327 [Enterococcus faecalis]|nr:hypothetical protein [Enterococcus faecalis]